MTKKEVREQIKTRIGQMTAEEREEASASICRKILESSEWQGAKTVWLYAALSDEVDLKLLFEDAVQSCKRVVLPVVDGDDLQLRFYDPRHTVSGGKFGIMEPTQLCPSLSDLSGIDLAIIPGRAFTASGLRMGRGKGYYDRKLFSLNCPKWGVAFECQMVETLPVDPWDVCLDRVITN